MSWSAGRRGPSSSTRNLFIYDHVELSGSIPDTMGFAGFRILYDLNKPGDELGAFLGASYFRFLCQKAVYGLSARGLAINTGRTRGRGVSRLRGVLGAEARARRPGTRGLRAA